MKRILITLALALSAVSSFGTTLNPIQLLNPAGSTSGQAIVSTGASTAPAWTTITPAAIGGLKASNNLSDVASATAALTNLGGLSTTTAASTYAPIASPTFTGIVTIPVNGVLTASPTRGDGTGKIATTFFVQDTLANPPTIGSGTAAPGFFTQINLSGSLVPNTLLGIVGTQTSDNANAGRVGEYVTANASSVALTNAVSANITSISLTAGDWDVAGMVAFTNPGTSSVGAQIAGISTTSGAFGAVASGFGQASVNFASAVAIGSTVSPMPTRISVPTTTTVYLVAQANFTVSTFSASGYIRARRVR